MKRIKRENVETIDFAAEGYQYVWLQEFGRVELLPVDKTELSFDNLIEARVFSRDKELHIYEDDGLHAVETDFEEGDDCFEETQMLRGRFGKEITLRHYVAYDKDGQAYVTQTVICGYDAN